MLHGLATFAAGLFAGSTLYVTAVGQPVRLDLGPAIAVPSFLLSLPRTRRLNSALHVLSLLLALAVFALRPSAPGLLALLVLAPILPISLLWIEPLNCAIAAAEPPQAMALLARWGRLHGLRTLLGAAGFLLLALGG